MLQKLKISLSIPGVEKSNHYFSFRLQQYLQNQSSEYKKPGCIFVVSDIEGNFESFWRLLYKNGIINEYLQWKFKDNHLVILGDCFDRGEQVAECLWFIYSLEEKAKRDGGHVHFILGNHEIMNFNGDWRYVHPKYAVLPPESRYSTTALYDANNELWRWLRTKNIIEKIGDILFVHGGIADGMLQLRLSVSDINRVARPYYGRSDDLFCEPALRAIFDTSFSPFWFKGYYQESVSEEQVDATLAFYNVSTIVTGHTIVGHISSFYNGKVINVNTDHNAGISEALVIKDYKYYRVDLNANKIKVK